MLLPHEPETFWKNQCPNKDPNTKGKDSKWEKGGRESSVAGYRFSKTPIARSGEFQSPSHLGDSQFTSLLALLETVHLKFPSHWIYEKLGVHGTRSKDLGMKDRTLAPRL